MRPISIITKGILALKKSLALVTRGLLDKIPVKIPAPVKKRGGSPFVRELQLIFKVVGQKSFINETIYNIIGQKSFNIELIYNIIGRKTFIFNEQVQILGKVQRTLDVDYILKALLSSNYNHQININGQKYFPISKPLNLKGSKIFDLNENKKIQGKKAYNLNFEKIIKAKRSFELNKISILKGKKQHILNETKIIKGKKNITNILMALDLYD